MNLTIEDWLPPPVLNVSRQRHWTQVRREAAGVVKLVYWSAAQAGWKYVGDDAPKQRLTVVFTFPAKRRRDIDNLTARAKYLIDGIKPFIHDDSMEYLEVLVRAEIVPGVKQTTLTLERA